jgi:hypothetical protein
VILRRSRGVLAQASDTGRMQDRDVAPMLHWTPHICSPCVRKAISLSLISAVTGGI